MAKGLIDADKLHEAVQRVMEEYDGCGLYDRLVLSGLVTADALIALAYTVDAVEVVRCQDCKHYKILICEVHSEYPDQYTAGHTAYMEPDDFCSYGERKEE